MINHISGLELIDFAGSNLYGVPPSFAKWMGAMFPNFAVSIFFLIRKTREDVDVIKLWRDRSLETILFCRVVKLLIVKLSALGDVLASTPFFRLIKQRHPDWEIHHLVMQHYASITESNPWVDRQVVVDFLPSGVDGGISAPCLLFGYSCSENDMAWPFYFTVISFFRFFASR